LELRCLRHAGLAREVNPWLVALIALTALRLVLAAILPLSPDEAYYWVWSRDMQPGYLDHPPMVAIFIWLGTAMAGESALGVRLLGPVSLFIGSLMLARTAEDLFPGRSAGPWAAALMNATLFAALGAVTMTPDTPLLFFWVATLWAVARAHRSGDARWWLVAGAVAGGALLSKYTAALLGLGLVIWLFLLPEARRFLLRWQLWVGGALALALFSPVLFWNAAHEWASFAKQGGRTASGGAGQSLRWLGELLGGQVALVTPLVFLLCVAGGLMAAPARYWCGAAAGADPAWRGDFPLAGFGQPGTGELAGDPLPECRHRRRRAAARGLAAAPHPCIGAGLCHGGRGLSASHRRALGPAASAGPNTRPAWWLGWVGG
jgi:4-amino-4-deoxy-L-arabinose transferase-like glycosyltransferase